MTLTDDDRRNIDACYEREWGGGETKVAEYYLCEAGYLAGLRAGMERAAKIVDRLTEDADRATYDECAAAIRAAKDEP